MGCRGVLRLGLLVLRFLSYGGLQRSECLTREVHQVVVVVSCRGEGKIK